MSGDVIECPVCGDLVDTSRVADSLKGSHVPIHGPKGQLCEASGLPADEALDIALMRAEGGERFRLAAHP